MEQQLEKPQRVAILDELRGLSILLMVFYHGLYDLVEIFGVRADFFRSAPMRWLQVFIASLFILISGVACRYSRNNLKRGLLCFGVGMGMTVATALFIPSQLIVFGILHFMGVSMMLFSLLQPLLDRVHPLVGIFLSLGLYFFTEGVAYGTLGFWKIFSIPLPDALYQVGYLFPLGFYPPFFFSSDYFPLLPWFFLFLMGSFLGVYFRRGLAPGWMVRSHCKPLAAVGRKSIWVYILHQPILYGLFWVIFNLLG